MVLKYQIFFTASTIFSIAVSEVLNLCVLQRHVTYIRILLFQLIQISYIVYSFIRRQMTFRAAIMHFHVFVYSLKSMKPLSDGKMPQLKDTRLHLPRYTKSVSCITLGSWGNGQCQYARAKGTHGRGMKETWWPRRSESPPSLHLRAPAKRKRSPATQINSRARGQLFQLPALTGH